MAPTSVEPQAVVDLGATNGVDTAVVSPMKEHQVSHVRWSFIIGSVLLVLRIPTLQAQGPSSGSWRVRVAIVVGELEVKPVPLYAFHLMGQPDSTIHIPTRTSLDGISEGQAPAGSYLLVSDVPARANGVAYTWRVPITIVAGKTIAVDLTNVNASIDSSTANDLTRGGRRIEGAVVAYRRVRRGVFRIEAGTGHGTGFLVDSAMGLVVTNAHVVSGQLSAYAVLDSVTRVAAVVLARSEVSDVAVLWLPPRALLGRPSLSLAEPKAGEALVEAGEHVFAVGYPLHQEQTLTTGIVSSIRDGAIISDVNINHGNSGGPMLNYAGVVVGVNTFGDFTDQGGPGISGAIVATRIWPVLEQARVAMGHEQRPLDILLPTMPLTAYPLDSLQAVVAGLPSGYLKPFTTDANGRFDIGVSTPVTLALLTRVHDDDVARDRHEREAASGLSSEQRYSSLAQWRDWMKYAGSQLAPVVQVIVEPKIGETGGSVLGGIMVAALTGAASKATFKYKADVQSVTFYRNGAPVIPIFGGTRPVEVYTDNQWVSLKDVANTGIYFLDPLLFAPDSQGRPPTFVIEIKDLKHPDDPTCKELSHELVAFTWNDFRPYLKTVSPQVATTLADPKLKPRSDRWLPPCSRR